MPREHDVCWHRCDNPRCKKPDWFHEVTDSEASPRDCPWRMTCPNCVTDAVGKIMQADMKRVHSGSPVEDEPRSAKEIREGFHGIAAGPGQNEPSGEEATVGTEDFSLEPGPAYALARLSPPSQLEMQIVPEGETP